MKRFLINFLLIFCAAFFLGGCSDDDETIEKGAKLEVSETSLRFGSLATELTIQLTSDQPWKIMNIPAWLKVVPESGDAGDFEIKVSALANAEEIERKVRLEVVAGSETWNLAVFQLEKGVLEFEEKEFLALYNHTSLKVPYRANGTLNVTFSDGVDWISVPASKAVTEQDLVFKLKVNDSGVLRETFVYLDDTQSGLKDTLEVVQYPEPKYELSGSKLFAKFDVTEKKEGFECNIPFEVVFDDESVDWVSLKESKLENGKFEMSFKLVPNNGNKINRTNFRLENKVLGLSLKMSFSQMYKTFDGHSVIRKEPTYEDPFGGAGASIGKLTFNFVLVGDGFTKEEIEAGVCDTYYDEVIEGIETLEPFKTYSERFGFILLHAESKESGCTDHSTIYGPKIVDTRFKCAYEKNGTGMTCDYTAIQNFVTESLQKEGVEYEAKKDVVIVIANGKRYGGVANLTRTGEAVAICPVSEEPFPNNFIQIMRHEACGHAFGKLADEYSMGGPIDATTANYLKTWQSSGMYLNVSLSSTEFPQPWQDLKNAGKLPNVYVGGFACSGGVWRSSENSLMKGMDEGFNILSRYLIYLRMKNLRGEGMDLPAASVDDFLSKDKADEKQ